MKHVTVKTTGTTDVGKVYVGTTHTAIQEAVNYVDSQEGGSVFIEAGEYEVSIPIDLPSNIEIYGEGQHTYLKSNISGTSSTDAVLLVEGTIEEPKENVYIHDLFIGNKGDTTVGYIGIACDYVGFQSTSGLTSGDYSRYDPSTAGVNNLSAQGVRIENCTIQSNKDYSIRLIRSYNTSLSGNTLLRNNTGIFANFSRNISITCNYVSSTLNSPVRAVNSDQVKVIGNTIQNSRRAGIDLSSSTHCIITGNTVQNTTYGIETLNVVGSTVSGNTIQNNSSSGVYTSNSEGNTIIGNTIQNNRGRGIHFYSTPSNKNTIAGNTIQHNDESGVQVAMNASYNTFLGNTVFGNNSYGIWLESGSNKSNVTGNISMSNRLADINNSGSSNNVVQNKT